VGEDTRGEKLSRRNLLKSGAIAGGGAALSGGLWKSQAIHAAENQDAKQSVEPPFQFRAMLELLHHPYYHQSQGNIGAANRFWDKTGWENALRKDREEGYNVIIWFVDPWLRHLWPDFMIRNQAYPEARELTDQQADDIIAHLNWVFDKAHELGLQNIIFNHCIFVPLPFAVAHGLDQLPDATPTVARYGRGPNWGVRNELTRAYTQAAITELFQTYPSLDGMVSPMGETLPGKRSTWFAEAIVPGLEGSGRNPLFILHWWLMPFEDFMADIVKPNLYDNVMLMIEYNGEVIDDPRTYPILLRWAEESGWPTIMEVVKANTDGDYFPNDSPKYAYDTLHYYRKIDNCVGSYLQVSGRDDQGHLYRKAFGYYSENDVPYSDEPWLAELESKFGNRGAAERFLRALDASFRIQPEMTTIAWAAFDIQPPRRLTLRYWHWIDNNPRFSYYPSPARGAEVIAIRHYAQMIALRSDGENFRNNNGSDYTIPPYQQNLIWEHIDFPVTPEDHMKKIKELGQICENEASIGRTLATANQAEAESIYRYMHAYRMLTEFYELKVLTAISALIYHYNEDPAEKVRAESLADQTLASYETAINYVWNNIDNRQGNIRGSWHNENLTLPQLIEAERTDRQQLPILFNWPAGPVTEPADFFEDWNLGSIDSAKWLVSRLGTSRCELEHLGGGDYAIFTLGGTDNNFEHGAHFHSKRSFPRGQNLRCTFKAWGDPSKTSWLGAFPSAAMIAGPWRNSNNDFAYNDQEACVSLWQHQPLRFSQVEWNDGHIMTSAFNNAWVAATSKAKAVTIRVWLGNDIGAKCEWTTDGTNWIEELDTRGASDHAEVFLGFSTYGGAVFIDDILVENDLSGQVPSDRSIFKLH